MKEKEMLLAQLEQNQNDRQKLQDEATRLLKAIEDTEPTYSVGDRFKKDGGEKYILSVQYHPLNKVRVSLTNLKLGSLWSGSHLVKATNSITQDEFNTLAHSATFTRYWDYQKQEKV